MPPVTKGRLLVTPATLTTSASLAELAEAMNADRLDRGSVLTSGWGSLTDDENQLGRTGPIAFTAGEAVINPGDGGEIPEHVRGRLYWRQTSPAAVKVLGHGADQEKLLELQAADLFISETDTAGVLLVLMSLKNADKIKKQVAPYLLNTVRTVDPGATLITSTSPLDMGDADFFRWLLWRTYNVPEVSDRLTILEMFNLQSEDHVFRSTALSGGVDMDRLELLSLIMRSGVAFGPASVGLKDDEVGLDAHLQLWRDGSFSCALGDTGYDENPPRAEKGIRVTLDLAHKVIPELRRAYNADSAWRSTNRARSIAKAAEDLLAAHNALTALFPRP